MNTKTSTSSESQLYTILFIVFVGFIGISIAYPLFPPLFLHPPAGMRAQTWTINHRNLLLGMTLAAYPFGQFIGSPIIGAMSDKYGRRRILLSSLIGTMIGYFLTALALNAGQLPLLILCRLITGLAESSLALAQSIAADMKDLNKHKSFGGITMAASIGYVIGPLLGGFFSDKHFIHWFNSAIPFYIATALAALTFYFAYRILPETHLERSSSITSFWQQFNLIKHLRELTKHHAVKILLACSLVFTLGVDLFYEFGPVYLAGHFFMSAKQIAYYNVILSITIALSGAYLSQWVALFSSIQRTVTIFIALFAILLTLIPLTHSLQLLFVLFGLIGFTIPAAATMINVELSDTAGKEIQGKVMGMQMGLRMFGDTLICLFGGVLIIFSTSLPLFFGVLVALIALMIYQMRKTMGAIQK